MWTYALIDGDVARFFATAAAACAALDERYLPPRDVGAWRDAVRAWRQRTAAALPQLTTWARADEQARRTAHLAFVATLDLARRLAAVPARRSQPSLAAARVALDDLLEEFRPYLSVADVALRVAIQSGASIHDALAVARSIDRGELHHFLALRRCDAA